MQILYLHREKELALTFFGHMRAFSRTLSAVIVVAEVDLMKCMICVFVIYYRYWVNPEQCAVYQQQCCEHHGYWNW